MSDKIKCIAVDDEAPGLKVIEMYCKKIPFLELEKTFQNPVEAVTYIEENKPDLIFLDINMPDLNGMQFVNVLKNPPAIIFTTAYREYAPESYDVGAIDYLLKPILLDRFLVAVNKVKDLKTKESEANIASTEEENVVVKNEHPGFIFIKSDSRFFKVDLEDILYIEGMRDYVAIHTKEQKILTLSGIEKMLQRLPENDFIRIHRSSIVAIRHIDLVQHNHVIIGDKEISISNTYKEDLFKLIGK